MFVLDTGSSELDIHSTVCMICMELRSIILISKSNATLRMPRHAMNLKIILNVNHIIGKKKNKLNRLKPHYNKTYT